MTEMPAQEQIDRFWRRFGVKHRRVTLNNLFKYVVPKLGCNLTIHCGPKLTPLYTVQIGSSKSTTEAWLTIRDEDPAIALFWAINRLVHEPVLWCYEPINIHKSEPAGMAQTTPEPSLPERVQS